MNLELFVLSPDKNININEEVEGLIPDYILGYKLANVKNLDDFFNEKYLHQIFDKDFPIELFQNSYFYMKFYYENYYIYMYKDFIIFKDYDKDKIIKFNNINTFNEFIEYLFK
jgi:hypothetical protein